MKEVFARPQLYSHRGLGYGGKENTLASFSSCLHQDRLDGIELDVQQTADGKLVVMHDFNLKRVTGTDAKVSELSYAELKAIYPELPLLDEVFSLCQDKLLYDLEIKSETIHTLGLEERLLKMITSHHLAKKVVVSSFNPISLLRFKRISGAQIPTALIYSTDASVPKVLQHGLGRYVARPSYLKPEQAQAGQALKTAYQICTWTVDDVPTAQLLIKAGVMGIISNTPGELAVLFNL